MHLQHTLKKQRSLSLHEYSISHCMHFESYQNRKIEATERRVYIKIIWNCSYWQNVCTLDFSGSTQNILAQINIVQVVEQILITA